MTDTATPSTDDVGPGTLWQSAEQHVTLREVMRAAADALPAPAWNFLDGGSGDERTAAANVDEFASWEFRPRVATGISRPVAGTTFLGIPLSMPVLTAPFGFDGLFHPDGHPAVAAAASDAGVACIVPEFATFPLEEVAAAGPGAARIFQLVPVGDGRNVLGLVERAAAAGYSHVCVTLDTAMAGWRERSIEDRFQPDPSLVMGNYRPGSGSDPAVFRELLAFERPTWTWAELADVMGRAALPWIAKGVLVGDDARAAVGAGACAVLVSNHGGRQLDRSPAALRQLPEIVRAVARDVPVGVDGGVRRGADVVVALALGAAVVGIGRLAAMGLAAAGRDGVRRVLSLLHEEIVTTMALLGVERVDQLGPEHVQRADERSAE